MLKTTFKKEETKKLIYRDYKKFSPEQFKHDLEEFFRSHVQIIMTILK